MKQILNIVTYILLFVLAALIGIVLSCLILMIIGIEIVKN